MENGYTILLKHGTSSLVIGPLNTSKEDVQSLEEDGLIISGSYNKASFDKTKWYSIDYDKVFQIDAKFDSR